MVFPTYCSGDAIRPLISTTFVAEEMDTEAKTRPIITMNFLFF